MPFLRRWISDLSVGPLCFRGATSSKLKQALSLRCGEEGGKRLLVVFIKWKWDSLCCENKRAAHDFYFFFYFLLKIDFILTSCSLQVDTKSFFSAFIGYRYILRFTPKANQRNFSAITEGNTSSLTVICSNKSKSTRDLL